MRLALLGDIHSYRLLLPPWQLLGKHLAGQINLWLNRRQLFDLQLLPPTLERVASIKPDLLLFSGDLTTTSLAGEFRDVAAALAPLVAKVPALAVPGNHDRYTLASAWGRRMEKLLRPGIVPERFPHIEPLTRKWSLLALDAAVPRFFTSRGRLGRRQLAEARERIAGLPHSDGLIVLCHYSLTKPSHLRPSKWQHRLEDADELRGLLAAYTGRVLYLHGHVHCPWRFVPDGLGKVTDLNAGSPCLCGRGFACGQGFWQIDLPADPAAEPEFVHHIMELTASGGRAWVAKPAR